jgi:hypothetical protein
MGLCFDGPYLPESTEGKRVPKVTRCNFWDCGWCYAPPDTLTNARDGACEDSSKCPHFSQGLRKGDYVLATKYEDGDPCDHFCIGFLTGILRKGSQIRYDVVDNGGKLFRGNGFRKVEKITSEEGAQMLSIFPKIGNRSGPSVWSHLERIRQGSVSNNKIVIPDPWFN